ncbi:hypothetical protein AUP68_05784 [Ilyonectria robusta]
MILKSAAPRTVSHPALSGITNRSLLSQDSLLIPMWQDHPHLAAETHPTAPGSYPYPYPPAGLPHAFPPCTAF